MARQDRLSLHQVAEALQIEPIRLYRLGRHFRRAPGDPCVPRSVIERARAETETETRYHLILEWFLTQVREDGSGSP